MKKIILLIQLGFIVGSLISYFIGCDLGKLRKEFNLIMKYDNKYRPYWFAKIVKNINK